MSGYSAEYGIPAGDRNEELADLPAETPAPIILTNKPEGYSAWEFMGMLSSRYSNDELIEEQEMGDIDAFDKARLIQTVRGLIRIANRDIQPDDYRLNHIWERAGEIADGRGYCDVFDSIMEELGTGYTREEAMVSYVDLTITVPVYVTVKRGGEPADYIENSDVEEALSNWTGDITSDMWSIDYSESAE